MFKCLNKPTHTQTKVCKAKDDSIWYLNGLAKSAKLCTHKDEIKYTIFCVNRMEKMILNWNKSNKTLDKLEAKAHMLPGSEEKEVPCG